MGLPMVKDQEAMPKCQGASIGKPHALITMYHGVRCFKIAKALQWLQSSKHSQNIILE